MNDNEIEIKFIYNGVETIIKCKSNEKIKQVLIAICSKIGKDLNKLLFLVNGDIINESIYEEPITKLKQDEGLIALLINDNEDINEERKISVCFWLDNVPLLIGSSERDNMNDIVNSFGQTYQIDINQYDFFYRNQNLNLDRTIIEIASINDRNRGQMDVMVRRNQTPQISEFTEISQISPTSQRHQISQISFCKKYKRLIIFGGFIIGILIIALIIFLILYFKSKSNKNKDDEEENTERCLTYMNSDSTVCMKCKDDFEMFKGKCIPYAFYGKYDFSYFLAYQQLLNPKKIENILAMKINDENIISPVSHYDFEKMIDNKVFFYLDESTLIDYMKLDFIRNRNFVDDTYWKEINQFHYHIYSRI